MIMSNKGDLEEQDCNACMPEDSSPLPGNGLAEGNAEMTTLTNQDAITTAFRAGSNAVSSPLILLAEDNNFTAETMQDYLQFHGFRVNVASNGYEVIEQALANKPDLIIMDIQMPGLNGFEATHRLRLEPSMVDIPIIALTALAMAGDRERCLSAGANAYYSKPISLKQVMEIIRQFLSK